MDVIVVTPSMGGFASGIGFTPKDLADIKRINGVKWTDARISGISNVEYGGEKQYVQINGVNPTDFQRVSGDVPISDGRMLKESDKRACVVGRTVAENIFGHIHLNSSLKIGEKEFKVVGISERGGSTNLFPVDSSILITDKDAKDLFGEVTISTVFVKVKDAREADKIANEIKEGMDRNHRSKNFTLVMTISQFKEIFEIIISMLGLFLGAIVAISLIVAALFTMSTMFMSIMERTHEIGVMKAIGAKNSNILSLFISETLIISAIGGAVGCLLGGGASWVFIRLISSPWFIRFIGSSQAIDIPVPINRIPEIILAGMSIAIIVGVLSGLYPAWKASKMSPAEAVRYE
jgi:putative ABC transport system permease protein